MASKQELLDCIGDFTWNFGGEFFVETPYGNYVWSDPDYIGGDNSFVKFDGNYKDWIRKEGISFGRSKGKHLVKDYCGTEIVVKK